MTETGNGVSRIKKRRRFAVRGIADSLNCFYYKKKIDSTNGFEMRLIVVEAIRERCASFMILTATVWEIFGRQTNSYILVVYMSRGYNQYSRIQSGRLIRFECKLVIASAQCIVGPIHVTKFAHTIAQRYTPAMAQICIASSQIAQRTTWCTAPPTEIYLVQSTQLSH